MVEELRETIEEWTDWGSELLFGPTPKQMLRRANLDIQTQIRKLDREKAAAVRREQKLIGEFRTAAPKARAVSDLRPAALAIARARRGVARIAQLQFQLYGLSQQMLETETQAMATTVLRSVTQALTSANAIVGGASGAHSALQQYERQKMMMETNQDIMDDLHSEETEHEDADQLLAELADKLSIELQFELPAVARASSGANSAAVTHAAQLLAETMPTVPSGVRPPTRRRRDDDDPPSNDPSSGVAASEFNARLEQLRRADVAQPSAPPA